MLVVSVVENDIPLLISKKDMKKIKMQLNFTNDTVNIHGKVLNLRCTSSGHYCISVNGMEYDDELNNVVLHADEVKSYTVDEKMKKAKKLHRQFAHSSVEELLTLIRRSKFKDKELEKCLEEVTGDCSFCRKYKKAPSQPIVGFNMSEQFNDLINMDLKDYIHNEIWILHLIDAATRYSAASYTARKKMWWFQRYFRYGYHTLVLLKRCSKNLIMRCFTR